MICKNCGTLILEPVQTFCPNCGASLTIILKYNDKNQKFEEVKRRTPLYNSTISDITHLFIDHNNRKVWLTHGSKSATQIKIIIAKFAPPIRKKYGIDYKFEEINEGKEPLEFKRMLGLDIEAEKTDKKRVSIHNAEHLILFEKNPREKKTQPSNNSNYHKKKKKKK